MTVSRESVRRVLFLVLALTAAATAVAAPARFAVEDIFELEWATDPQVSPDGKHIVYVRNGMDVMRDRRRSALWIVDANGENHRPLTAGEGNERSPRWSPDGERLLFMSSRGGSSQIWVRFMDSGQRAPLTRLRRSPAGLSWSPDGSRIAFSMFVPGHAEPFASMPSKPEGAEWAAPPVVIDTLIYRADGRGYLDAGYRHLFVLSAEGGTPRQVTEGEFNHGGTPVWMPDGRTLVFSANRHEDWQYDPRDSEIYALDVDAGPSEDGGTAIRALTDRHGPDGNPTVSPDGKHIAYTGHDERYQGYQVQTLYVMEADGGNRRVLTADLDRTVQAPRFAGDKTVFFSFSTEGNTKVARASLRGDVEVLTGDLGGTSLGRPYSGGSFSVAPDGTYAFTYGRPERPAEVALGAGSGKPAVLTRLNGDLLDHRAIAGVEEVWWESSHDGLRIQGWIATPPDFDPSRKYPLILEIHGGPFADYGDRFSTEVQLYAAAGYVVLYANPRGSSSYGAEFGNAIHHAYPGYDFDDLMSGVDAVLARGYVDPERLYVTGGSGGGVLSAWIVGKTDRFRAAVVAKPVINWYSFALTADSYNIFYKYWFPGFPWDHAEHYLARSPISLVGNVTTPTMLLTGEEDHRTPIAESEQYYQALKLRRIDSALVRIPGASHGIAARPSNLIAKVNYILAWFERYAPGD